jgi:hypothetical protein
MAVQTCTSCREHNMPGMWLSQQIVHDCGNVYSFNIFIQKIRLILSYSSTNEVNTCVPGV